MASKSNPLDGIRWQLLSIMSALYDDPRRRYGSVLSKRYLEVANPLSRIQRKVFEELADE